MEGINEEIEVKIIFKPEDFKRNRWLNSSDCPLSRCIKRQISPLKVNVGWKDITANGDWYDIKDGFKKSTYNWYKFYYSLRLHYLFGNLTRILIKY